MAYHILSALTIEASYDWLGFHLSVQRQYLHLPSWLPLNPRFKEESALYKQVPQLMVIGDVFRMALNCPTRSQYFQYRSGGLHGTNYLITTSYQAMVAFVGDTMTISSYHPYRTKGRHSRHQGQDGLRWKME